MIFTQQTWTLSRQATHVYYTSNAGPHPVLRPLGSRGQAAAVETAIWRRPWHRCVWLVFWLPLEFSVQEHEAEATSASANGLCPKCRSMILSRNARIATAVRSQRSLRLSPASFSSCRRTFSCRRRKVFKHSRSCNLTLLSSKQKATSVPSRRSCANRPTEIHATTLARVTGSGRQLRLRIIPACLPTYLPTHEQIDGPTFLPSTSLPAYLPTCLPTLTDRRAQTYLLTYIHIHTSIHPYIHTCIHPYIHSFSPSVE